MSQAIWSTLSAKGLSRDALEPALKKHLGPPTTLAKPQFREAFLREVATLRKSPAVTHEETIELALIADDLWESWPGC